MNKVLTVRFELKEPSFDFFDSAVSAIRRSARAKRAEADNSALVHASIVGYKRDDVTVELALSENRSLRVSVDGPNVVWELAREAPRSGEVGSRADEITLRYSDRDNMVWEPDSLLLSRMNRTGIRIAPSISLVYLYVKGCPGLMFGQMIERETGRCLLYFGEE